MPKLNLGQFDDGPLDILDATGDQLTLATQRVSTPIPNLFPTLRSQYRLAIIGDFPGETESKVGQPFVGMGGRLLDNLLSRLNILRSSCFLGSVNQHAYGIDITTHPKIDDSETQSGINQLSKDLAIFKPNCVLLLGKLTLHAFKNTSDLDSWRGSVFISHVSPFTGLKCIASRHPTSILRMYEWLPLLTFDLRRAIKESTSNEYSPPVRNLQHNLNHSDLLARLDDLLRTSCPVSCDIEGGVSDVSCLSFATSPSDSFIVPFTKLDKSSAWTIDQEVSIWQRVAAILSSPLIPKIWQNGLYDRFVLQWAHRLIIRNSADDTMLKFWSAYCELEKSLAFQCSILTDEPFYKMERKSQDQQTYYEYCCKDSAVTFEINSKLEKIIEPSALSHYRFNNALLNPLLYMELRGIRYNETLANSRLQEMGNHVARLQELLDTEARRLDFISSLPFDTNNANVLSELRKICCYKKDGVTPKKAYIEDGYYEIEKRLQEETPLTTEERGRISMLAGTTMNTKSSKFKDFLYSARGCNLPTQWKKDPTTKELRITTDYEALLKLTKTSSNSVLRLALDLSLCRTRAQMLSIRSYHGRMHCSYNLVGSETGRVTSSKSMIYVDAKKRVGANMQTIADNWEVFSPDHPLHQGMRDLYTADAGCYLLKADLKGADGWTVGAYMAMLGDPTMLDDLKFGLKPAQIVAYILKHGASQVQLYANNRQKLKELCSEIKKDDWEYFVSKQGIWGTCYTMGPRKLAEVVFIQSEGKVNLSERQAKDFQNSIYVRYRVKLWHEWMQRHLSAQPYPAKLICPNGSIRKFFGRKDEILGEALAHVPQVVTTYATLQAAYRLWTDPENRITEGSLTCDSGHPKCALRIEPLHQVHDELVVQCKIEDIDFAKRKIAEWFNNEIVVAGQRITIPYDGSVGTTWAMDKKSKVCDL